ncbi:MULTISPECIES: SDR family NAD(P)-dependent oxidoreductase [Pseudomonas]|uniref:SDR family NAD(P)-dependent oxidoreductase n=1 Tax=Pseudomonas TaxID=286 RepID=UPI00398FA29E
MAKTIVIVGAGGTMGLSIARQFGKNGYNVGLIARNQEKLSQLAADLAKDGVTNVSIRTADVLQQGQLTSALASLRYEFGSIDVLEYSPALGPQNYRSALDVTPELAQQASDLLVVGAIRAITSVLPAMRERKSGSLLFIAGGSAMKPIPPLANVGIATSGLRNYLTNLHGALKQDGVYVGAIYVGGIIKRGTEVDPDNIAAKLYEMHQTQDKHEDLVLGPPPPGAPGAPGPK